MVKAVFGSVVLCIGMLLAVDVFFAKTSWFCVWMTEYMGAAEDTAMFIAKTALALCAFLGSWNVAVGLDNATSGKARLVPNINKENMDRP
jgi:hypothetical protein